jgi:hypothetical protein
MSVIDSSVAEFVSTDSLTREEGSVGPNVKQPCQVAPRFHPNSSKMARNHDCHQVCRNFCMRTSIKALISEECMQVGNVTVV